jgi:hypothetical protein
MSSLVHLQLVHRIWLMHDEYLHQFDVRLSINRIQPSAKMSTPGSYKYEKWDKITQHTFDEDGEDELLVNNVGTMGLW